MAPRRKNGSPEHSLQMAVKEFLTFTLPDTIEWTASATGRKMSIRAAKILRDAGVRRGWPDLQFLFPDGVTRYIELKTPVGSLTPEQRDFRDRCAPHGIFGVARSVDDVELILSGWGADLKALPAFGLLYNRSISI